MSRTFRIRHLPKINAKKFTNGSHRIHRKRQDDLALDELGYGERPYRWDGDLSIWHAWEKIKKKYPLPVAHMCNHPWVSWGMAGYDGKREYRRVGNRALRRATRNELKNMIAFRDYEDYLLPERKEYVDPWDVW